MARELLHRFSAVMRVDLVYEDADGSLTAYFDSVEDSPLMKDSALRERLRVGAAAQTRPFALRDKWDAYYITQHYRNGWLHLGPMFSDQPDPLKTAAWYRSHHISPEGARQPRAFTLRQIKDISVLAASISGGADVSEADFLVANPAPVGDEREIRRGLSESATEDEESREAEEYKHTYREEQMLLQAAREGRVEDTVRLSEQMDADSGRLSHQDLNHWKLLAIISVTLVSRAAIEGGLPPETAYRLSGYYIGRCAAASGQAAVMDCRSRALEDMVGRVRQLRKKPKGSGYTAKCRDYIQKHFREKIYIEDIAEPMGISAGYLAKLFKKETGFSIQEYINRVRVERAANLLVYSEMSLPAIADYVHFPTQSYFGKMFKELKGVTPNEYRRQNKVHEFFED